MDDFLNKLSFSKIVVVLRHIKTEQCDEYISILEQHKFTNIEVTLNSNNAYESIERIAKKFPNINLGAGTVIHKTSIRKLSDFGVKFIVSPNTDPEIITETLSISTDPQSN